LYIGAIPVLLLLIGAVRGILWHREIRFFTCCLIFVLLYALGWYTPAFRAMYDLMPGVSLYRRPAAAVFLIGGLAAIIAGYIAHRLLTWSLPPPRPWQRVVEILSVAAAFATAFLLAVDLDKLQRAIVPLTLAAGCIAVGAAAIAFADW